MIISASRRTDLPAFYVEWFMNRIQAGYCTIPNPFNRRQVSRISLEPGDVDFIVFWSRHPRPIFKSIKRLESLGYCFYFQFTVLDYPPSIEPKGPGLTNSIREFQQLASMIGADRVIWRYDPIIFSTVMDSNYHLERFSQIAESLSGFTNRVVISVVDIYRKNKRNLFSLEKDYQPILVDSDLLDSMDAFFTQLTSAASNAGMTIQSCAEAHDLKLFGIQPGKCVDDQLIQELTGNNIPGYKDPSQRSLCRCIRSSDIGMYDSCPFGCIYCYATKSVAISRRNHQAHDPTSPSLLGWYE